MSCHNCDRGSGVRYAVCDCRLYRNLPPRVHSRMETKKRHVSVLPQVYVDVYNVVHVVYVDGAPVTASACAVGTAACDVAAGAFAAVVAPGSSASFVLLIDCIMSFFSFADCVANRVAVSSIVTGARA